jgi:glutathionylspermidine synthase
MSSCTTMPESVSASPWRCGPALAPDDYRQLLRRAIFDCCKWHIQVQDQPALCPFPLLIDGDTWHRLARMAEELARETLAAEAELLQRPDLHAELGLPRTLGQHVARIGKPEADAVRVIRFDFHWTAEGWHISEANTDVAAGYIEASGVTRLMAQLYPGCASTGDPAGALAAAICQRVGAGGKVGLMHLSIYVEDRQIMLYLARRLAEAVLAPVLFNPMQLTWHGGVAHTTCESYTGPIDLVFRFLPAEWLRHLPRSTMWPRLVHGGATPVCNPVYAVLSQSKRFPLVWDRLAVRLPMWRSLLPESRRPQRFTIANEGDWAIKPALSHEGHDIGMSGVTDASDWRSIRRRAWWNPAAWVCQRRFTPIALPTPEGSVYPCLGIYVIDGRAAGAFGRVAPQPLIDDRSREIVVLIADRP